jgi:hypothetical protein
VEFDFSVNRLCRFKKYVDITGVFLRENTTSSRGTSFSLSSESRFLKKLRLKKSTVSSISSELTFSGHVLESGFFDFASIETRSTFDSVDLIASLNTSYPVTGLKLFWTTVNAHSYTTLSLVLAGLAMLSVIPYHSYCITFVWFMYRDNLFSFVLAAASFATTNPLVYLLDIDVEFIGCFITLFLWLIKVHLMYKLREIQIVDDGQSANLCFAGFMVLYLLVDEFATVSRENRVLRGEALGAFEFLRFVFHVAFAVVVAVYYNQVTEVDDEAHLLRSRALLGMICIVFAGEWTADIAVPLVGFRVDSIVWDVLKAAAGQAYFAAFALFFKRKLARYDINPLSPTVRLDGQWVATIDEILHPLG